MTFIFPFMNFFQPGVFWPQLADYKPMLAFTLLALIVGFARKSAYPARNALAHPAFVWLALFILIQPLSLVKSGIMVAVSESAYWGMYLIFVWASLLLIRDERTLASYIRGMLAGAMFIVIFGILAAFSGWPQAIGGRAGAYGMYENHNDYSFLIIQIVPFLFMYRKVAGGAFLRLLLNAALVLCVLGIVLSLSRGGMLALVLECALIILIGMEGRKRLLWIPVLVLAGAAAIGFQWAKRAENQGDNYTAADAENSRLELWDAAYHMVLANPILGVGSGQFHDYASSYGEISYDNRGKNTHNTYLEILTGNGIIGFSCFLVMIVKLIRGLRRMPSSGPPLLDAMRRATLIALYAILFRATLDAKPHDWSFYVLCTIGVACIALQRQVAASAEQQVASLSDQDAAAAPSYGYYGH